MRFAERLPAHSHYKAAMADDDEYIRAYMAHQPPGSDKDQKQKPLTMQGYSMAVAALHEIADRVGALYSVTVAVNSKNGKAPDVPEMPRPQTALQRYKDMSVTRRHESIVAKVLPHKKKAGG
jgi:hypothetical protein